MIQFQTLSDLKTLRVWLNYCAKAKIFQIPIIFFPFLPDFYFDYYFYRFFVFPFLK